MSKVVGKEKMTKNQLMYQEIEKHGANLNAIFNTQFDNITLCKKLHSLEAKAHKITTDWCNGENGVNSDNIDTFTAPILQKVYKILGTDKYSVIVNGDARGYALKISDEVVRENGLKLHTDWGGYGILAPDFNN